MTQPRAYQWLTKLGRCVDFVELWFVLRYGMKAYQPVPFPWRALPRSDREEDATLRRWELISKLLPQASFTGLDVGCNIGYFSFKLAESGAALVLGVDTESGPILVAERLKQLAKVRRVAFCQYELGPDNAGHLGTFDVVLFLSVFHHLAYVHGFEAAKAVLRAMIRQTREIMFFETGQGDQDFGRMVRAMPGLARVDVPRFLEELLTECGAKSVRLLGTTSVKGRAERCLFAVRP